MVDLVQPNWPIEPTTLYVVSYYATNALGEAPASVYTTMVSLDEAMTKAKEVIASNNNEGVCTLQVTNAYIVYPAVGWQDF